MQNEEYYIDFFDYEYTVENLFKNGNYHLVMDNLTGTDRAISNLLFKENETIKTVIEIFNAQKPKSESSFETEMMKILMSELIKNPDSADILLKLSEKFK